MGSVSLRIKGEGDETTPVVGAEPTVEIRGFRISTRTEADLLSVSQFADEARITPQAVRKMIAEDRLRAQKVGEQHVISRDELNRYLSER